MFSLKSPTIALLLTLVVGVAAAVDFQTCHRDINQGVFGTTSGVDAYGRPVANISEAKGVNYTTCLHVCGNGTEPFDWSTFVQQFSAWLLPWLALISALPFGAEKRFDNVLSFLLAVGSPALAAYSLAITTLNHRWLAKRLAPVKYSNTKHFINIFSALQHIPIHLVTEGPLLPSLIVLPENDLWWSEMAERTEQTRNWNVPAALNIAWVLVALLFTIVYSFSDFGSFISSHGHAVAAAWMWLLPLVVGWLRIGSQTESNQLRRALRYSNALSHIATHDGLIRATKLPEQCAIDHASPENSRMRRDEQRAAPIFNYSRVLFWSQAAEHVADLYSAASHMAEARVTVDGREWVSSGSADGSMHEDNRVGNVDQVIAYCRSPQPSQEQKGRLGLSAGDAPSMGPRWAPGVVARIIIAAVLALLLQWCTSGAAFILTMLTATIGLGCRSMAYLVYGIAATCSLILLLLSSFLTHAARPSPADARLHQRTAIGNLAIAFRWTGKTIAIINVFVIIAACTFQFTNVYSNCFCMSSVIGRGEKNAFILFLTGSELIDLGTRVVWVGSVTLALGFAIMYGLFISLAASNHSL